MSTKRCPNCGEPFTDGMLFCGKCGATLTQQTAAAPVLGSNLEAHPDPDLNPNPVNNDESTIIEQTDIPVTQPVAAPPRKGGKFWMIGFFVLLAASLVLSGFLFKSCQDSDALSSSMQYENDRLSEQLSRTNEELRAAEDAAQSAQEEVDDLTRLKNAVASQIPFVITDMKIANISNDGDVITPAGSTIYSRDTRYLEPVITYYGIKSGTQTIHVKLFTPSGEMSGGSSHGYTFSQSMSVSTGSGNEFEFKGWGGNTPGHWPSGQYRYEIWCGDVCLKAKKFTIYS